MALCLHPTYFPNILTMSVVVSQDIQWEVWDNYQKQTYRNRSLICTDQGLHRLTVPIKHVGGEEGRQLYKDVLLDHSMPWLRQHWRGLQTAYRTSPFFEYYEDDLAGLFKKKHTHLLPMNFEILEVLADLIGFELSDARTEKYDPDLPQENDARFLVSAKEGQKFENEAYQQVFADRHGFISNVSVLDLLFNMGPESLAYLKRQAERWDHSSFPALKR